MEDIVLDANECANCCDPARRTHLETSEDCAMELNSSKRYPTGASKSPCCWELLVASAWIAKPDGTSFQRTKTTIFLLILRDLSRLWNANLSTRLVLYRMFIVLRSNISRNSRRRERKPTLEEKTRPWIRCNAYQTVMVLKVHTIPVVQTAVNSLLCTAERGNSSSRTTATPYLSTRTVRQDPAHHRASTLRLRRSRHLQPVKDSHIPGFSHLKADWECYTAYQICDAHNNSYICSSLTHGPPNAWTNIALKYFDTPEMLGSPDQNFSELENDSGDDHKCELMTEEEIASFAANKGVGKGMQGRNIFLATYSYSH